MTDISTIKDLFEKIPLVITPNNTNLELELRFIIDSRKKYNIPSKNYTTDQTIELAKNIITRYKNTDSSIEQSVNFISDHNLNDNSSSKYNKTDSSIKQMIFVNGEQKKDKQAYYKKVKLIEPIFFTHNTYPAYRMNLNYETKIDEFPIKDCNLARIKLRYSIVIPTNKWRLDITLVKTVESFSNPTILKDSKTKMLFPISIDNFIEKAPWKYADIIEFELEYIGDMNLFTEEDLLIADEIFDVGNNTLQDDDQQANSSLYQSMIYEVAKFIKPKQAERFKRDEGIKQLSNQVIELDKNMYLSELADIITNYYITDKVDGKRAIVYLNKESYAITNEITPIEIKSSSVFIFDTEYYKDKYYIFDIMVWSDEVIIDLPFSERLEYFDKAIKEFSKYDLFKTKPFEKLNENYPEQLRLFKKEKKKYEVDGIVLTPADGKYVSMHVYKYKPISHLTVDFLIKRCPDKLLGINPYMDNGKVLYLLFCGISKNAYSKLGMKLIKHYDELFTLDYKHLPGYFPIQFQPSDCTYAYLYWHDVSMVDDSPSRNDASKVDKYVDDKESRVDEVSKVDKYVDEIKSTLPTFNSLDGEVGEFSLIADTTTHNMWKLHKIRTDRKVEVARGNYFGNNYKIAEMTWMSYKNPLVIEDLGDEAKYESTDGKVVSYFQKHDNQLQKESRNYNSFVKSEIFNQFRNTEWIMDVASGKGQDLFRYSKVGTRNLICLEIDKDAIMELIHRKHEFANAHDNNTMNIQVHQMDMLADYKNNIDLLNEISIPRTGVDLVICNFAFHYFLESKKTLVNVCKFINNYLKPGGRFIFTAFDGKAIIKLLNDNSGNWTHKVKTNGQDAEVSQYSIKKQYTVNHLDLIGQKIDVLMPFSSGYYTEYLVNIDYISDEFSKLGFVLETNESFDEYLQTYKKINSRNYSAMTEADKKYIGLYHYYCFYKKSK
jgi:SAM-dependent methyltransferase